MNKKSSPSDDANQPSSENTGEVFVASAEAKGKAKQLRLFAILAWIIAMAGQAFAIFKLISDETLVYLIVAIVVILALAITGSVLWKKANRLDPASEKEKVKFFIQNQLGAILGVLAFLPLVILIFMNKDIDGKTKGIAGTIAAIALLIAGISGADFAPPSVEQYTEEMQEQTATIKALNFDEDHVHWARTGDRIHIYQDCQYIRDREGVTSGTVEQSWEEKGLSVICSVCQTRAMNERGISQEDLDVVIPEDALEDAGIEN